MLIKYSIKNAALDYQDFINLTSSEKLTNILSQKHFDSIKDKLNLNIENQFVGQISMTEIQRNKDKAEQNKLYFSLNKIDLANFKHDNQLNPSLNELYYFDEIIEENDRKDYIYFCFTEEYSNNASIAHLLSAKKFEFQEEQVVNVSYDRVMIVDDKLIMVRNIFDRIQLLSQNDITLSAASLFNFFSGNDKLFQNVFDNIQKIKKVEGFDIKESILTVNKKEQPTLTLTTKHKNLLKIYLNVGLKTCDISEQLIGKQMVQQFRINIQQMQKMIQ